MRSLLLPVLAVLILAEARAFSADATPPELRTEHFDRDPKWEGHNNRVTSMKPVQVKQDFGFSATNHAGKAAGEMGGAVQRSTKPASYAAALSPVKTLDDKLTASGTFALTGRQPGAGLFFGFFHSQQPGDKSVTLALKPGQKAHGAKLDRFGVFNSTVGGQMVKLYLDDLQYTADPPK